MIISMAWSVDPEYADWLQTHYGDFMSELAGVRTLTWLDQPRDVTEQNMLPKPDRVIREAIIDVDETDPAVRDFVEEFIAERQALDNSIILPDDLPFCQFKYVDERLWSWRSELRDHPRFLASMAGVIVS